MFGNIGISSRPSRFSRSSRKTSSPQAPTNASASSLAAQAAAVTFNKLTPNSNANTSINNSSKASISPPDSLGIGGPKPYSNKTQSTSNHNNTNNNNNTASNTSAKKPSPPKSSSSSQQQQQKQPKQTSASAASSSQPSQPPPLPPIKVQLSKRNSDYGISGPYTSVTTSSPQGLVRRPIADVVTKPKLSHRHSTYESGTKPQPLSHSTNIGKSTSQLRLQTDYTNNNYNSNSSNNNNNNNNNTGPSTVSTSSPVPSTPVAAQPPFQTPPSILNHNANNDKSNDSLTALTAAALAAKKVSAASDSGTPISNNNHNHQKQPTSTITPKNKPALSNTGFLQPPSSEISKLMKPPSSPIPSNKSIISSSNSDLHYSPSGITLARKSSYDYFHSNDSLTQPQADEHPDSLNLNKRKPSVKVTKSGSQGTKLNQNIAKDTNQSNNHINNGHTSVTSLSDNISFSDNNNNNSNNDAKIKSRNMSPSGYFAKRNNTQDSFNINSNNLESPYSNPYSNASLANMSQSSLIRGVNGNGAAITMPTQGSGLLSAQGPGPTSGTASLAAAAALAPTLKVDASPVPATRANTDIITTTINSNTKQPNGSQDVFQPPTKIPIHSKTLPNIDNGNISGINSQYHNLSPRTSNHSNSNVSVLSSISKISSVGASGGGGAVAGASAYASPYYKTSQLHSQSPQRKSEPYSGVGTAAKPVKREPLDNHRVGEINKKATYHEEDEEEDEENDGDAECDDNFEITSTYAHLNKAQPFSVRQTSPSRQQQQKQQQQQPRNNGDVEYYKYERHESSPEREGHVDDHDHYHHEDYYNDDYDDVHHDTSLDNIQSQEGELPQYPLTVNNQSLRTHTHKGARNILKKTGNKVLRDLGLKSTNDYQNKNKNRSKKPEIKYYQINADSGANGAGGGGGTANGGSGQASIVQQQHVPFRKTMRKEKKKEKDFFNEDKPWKHHNDSIVVSEAEKKRYEGVWVANKGLYIQLMRTPLKHIPEASNLNSSDNVASSGTSNDNDDEDPTGTGVVGTATNPATISNAASSAKDSQTDQHHPVNAVSSHYTQDINHPSQLIHGYVVRNLWRRSNLSDDILAKIWNLVDKRQDGTLNRDEFVVGMWLVDQCLYGRKLPKSLDENVWASVKKLVVQVVIKPKKNKLLKS